MVFDLLIRGGEVIDPASGRRGRFDVAIRDGRIGAVEPSLAHVAAEHDGRFPLYDTLGQVRYAVTRLAPTPSIT